MPLTSDCFMSGWALKYKSLKLVIMSNKEQMPNLPHQPSLHKAGVGSSASPQYRLQDDWQYDDDGEIPLDTNCPKCNRTYDEIDYEYQICHICKHNNNKQNG